MNFYLAGGWQMLPVVPEDCLEMDATLGKAGAIFGTYSIG
jgi:hypothetical protein